MLARISISNIVLIDRLELDFRSGLSVLTGETGAGKSILLDALSLALGARSDAGLIRHGCAAASVTAEFTINNKLSAVRNLLEENGIDHNGELILRRTLAADGKSRAWANDIQISVKTLKQIGDELVEIHGQFENHALLDPSTHISALDEFGGYHELLENVRASYNEFYAAEKKLRSLREFLEKSAAEKEFLEHNVRELESLNPIAGEENELSARRGAMMDAEKNAAILKDAAEALSGAGRGIDEMIFSAAHVLERIKTDPNPYQTQIDKLYEAGAAIADIAEHVAPATTDTSSLESAEERLFALRAAARKHRVNVDGLPDKLQDMREQLAAIDDSDATLRKLETEAAKKQSKFSILSAELHKERIAASEDLRKAILGELPDLKLGMADFDVAIEDAGPAASGASAVTFMIKTNPGTPFAGLHKIASGGELARLMLALRVVLMHGNANKTFVFDEVDAGISGATASAVGERLARLAKNAQALVVTHSAQVAGFGDAHFLIKKSSDGKTTTTDVCEIKGDDRLREIARIISGEKITDESIATAKTLLKK
jgi:DNA repair protein RecN (Recombination protein N)